MVKSVTLDKKQKKKKVKTKVKKKVKTKENKTALGIKIALFFEHNICPIQVIQF